MDVFDLVAKIKMDISEYEKGLDKAQKDTHEFSSKVGSGVKSLAKVGAKVMGVASTAVGGFVKKSIDSYAQYEQLVGGVETLFGQSADKVKHYADEAYKTAGMSANKYMETVTSFSASLLQSMGGNTEKASGRANMAIKDMSDNANKMGTAIDSIQNAYQGFAKGNFSMLDNLKLGYGGTQKEMFRLLQDASKLNKTFAETANFSIDKKGHLEAGFGDIVKAIHIVQKEMKITGTTGDEAKKTIEGSAYSMKASWENLVTGVANSNVDFERLIDEFIASVTGAWKNFSPRIMTALEGVGTLVSKMLPKIFEFVPDVIKNMLPKLASESANLVTTLIDGLVKGLPDLINVAMDTGLKFVDAITNGFGGATEKVGEIITMLSGKLTEYLPKVIQKIIDFMPSLIEGIANMTPIILKAVLDIGTAVISKLPELITSIADKLPELIETVVSTLVENATLIFDALVKVVQELLPKLPDLVTALVDGLLSSMDIIIQGAISLFNGIVYALPDIITNIVNALPQLIDSIVNTLIGALPQILDGAVQMLMAVVDAIPVILPKLVDMLPEIIDTVCNVLLDNIPLILDASIKLFMGIVDAIPEIIRKLVPMIPRIVLAVEKALWKSVPKLLGTLGAIWIQLANTVLDLGKKMCDKIPKIWADIVVAFESGIDDIKKVGENIINGLWDGINGAKDWLLDKLGKLIDLLPKTVKKILGIASPSKVFAQIGSYMAQGLGVGWDSTFPDIQKDISNSLDFSSQTLPVKTSTNTQSNSIRADIAYMTDAIVSAIEQNGDTTIELNSREIGRMVRTYA